MRLSFATACLVLLMFSDNAFAQTVTVDFSTINHALLIAPTDPRFAPIRDAILNSAGSNDAIDNFQHIAVVLKNKSSEPILGYTIRWEVTSASGEVSKFNRIWWQRLALAAVKGEANSKDPGKVRAALAVQVAAPGESRLISPFFNISKQSDVARLGTGSFSGPSQFPEQVLNAASINVTLDSVVYGDGLCEGEDTLNLCNSINGQLDGIRLLVQAARQLEGNDMTRQQVLDQLLGKSSATALRGPSRKASAEEWSEYAKAMLIEEIGRIRSRHGNDKAMEEIYRVNTSFRVHR
jgi:hypothetical protein